MAQAESLYADDSRARELALDTGRSFIVQAPAGSGKTELLIQRYLRLLATVDQPEEILAITFTNKAASEMLTRVVRALEDAPRHDVERQPHEQTTADAARAVLRRDAEQGWQLDRHHRRLRIVTLDSLNASIARMQPVTSGSMAAGAAVADEAAIRSLHREAAMATLEWLGSANEYGDAIQTVLGHLDNHTGLYADYLASMLAVRDQWMPFIGSGRIDADTATDLRAALEAGLRSVADEHLAGLTALVPEALLATIRTLAAFARDTLAAGGDGSHPFVQLADRDDPYGQWLAAADLLLVKNRPEFRKAVDKRQGFPPDAKDRKRDLKDLIAALDRLPDFRQRLNAVRVLPPAAYPDAQWRVLLALIRLLPVAVAELKQLFSRRGLVDFVEVAQAADEALGSDSDPTDVALLMDYRVSHILIDEMQDTSLAQYDMLSALTRGWTAGDGRTLFCVGDPMQSIYRFRNAEVAQFLHARETGIGDVQLGELVLRRNFRSGEYLVNWFNRTFPDVLPARDDPATSAVSYAESVSAEALSGFGEVRIHPLLGTSSVAEAKAGCEVIGRLLDEHPNDSVAVLVRSRTVLPDLLMELRRAEIEYQAVDIDRLTDLPEVIEVLALARAAVHPCDRHAWLAVLRAPWIGLSWQDLKSLVGNDVRASVWELLNDPERLSWLSGDGRARVARALPVLADVRAGRRVSKLRDVVESAWLKLGGAAIPAGADAIENVYRILDVIGRIEQAGTLDDVASLEAELDQERVSSSRPARLSLLTMHKAKGLQFDHVVLYGLGRQPGTSRSRVLSWVELPPRQGVERRILSPIAPRDVVEQDPVHRYVSSLSRERERLETGRLLYVACTRARKSLSLIGHAKVGERKGSPELKPPHPGSLLALLWDVAGASYQQLLDAGAAPDDGEDIVWGEPVLRRFTEPFEPPAVTSPFTERQGKSISAAAVEYDWVGSDARFAGTLVHRWLKEVAEGRIELDANRSGRGETLFARWLDDVAAPARSVDTILSRVHDAIDRMSRDERGKWLASGRGYAELSLTGELDGQLITGVIDRVRIDDEVHWIVDYKTSSHEGGDLSGFLRAEAERYREQLRRYRQLYAGYSGRTARCALYFPLLAEFLEVSMPGDR